MLKCYINGSENIKAEFDFQCTKEVADEISSLIDYILSYELININPDKTALCEDEITAIISKEKETILRHIKESRIQYYELSGTRKESEDHSTI